MLEKVSETRIERRRDYYDGRVENRRRKMKRSEREREEKKSLFEMNNKKADVNILPETHTKNVCGVCGKIYRSTAGTVKQKNLWALNTKQKH
jgi:hypothetical protein